jgi:hypothetical protein
LLPFAREQTAASAKFLHFAGISSAASADLIESPIEKVIVIRAILKNEPIIFSPPFSSNNLDVFVA